MAKTVLPSKIQEWKGLDRISTVVHEMQCIFRELSKDDFGLDGEIEVVALKPDGIGLAATGGIIKVQAKSGASYVKKETATSFVTPVTQSDLEYWHNATFPVLFIVYHPGEERLYWKEVRSYVRNAENVWRVPRSVEFDKTADEFSPAAYDQICAIAQVSPPRVSLKEQEQLFSNLLPIKRLPRIITYAPTEYSASEDFDWIRSQVEGDTPPFRLLDGRLYTITDLRNAQNPLRPFCDTGSIGDLLVDNWVGDAAHRRDFVSLLNQTLAIHMRSCGLWYDRHFRRNFFPRLDESGTEFKMRWNNVRTGWEGPRTVVKHYTYGGLKFWRHTAANISFQQLGSKWFLQVLPKYLYTTDGSTPYDSDLVGPLTTKVKALEKNQHVLNHVLFWADVLAKGRAMIEMGIGPRPLIVVEKMPVTGIANFAIPYDPATYDAPDEEAGVQLTMFDSVDEDEGDDEYWG